MFKCVEEFEFAAQLFWTSSTVIMLSIRHHQLHAVLVYTAVSAVAAKIESLGPTIWSILILHYLLQQAGLQVHSLTHRKIRLEVGKNHFQNK